MITEKLQVSLNIAKVSKAHIPPAVAIRGRTTLFEKGKIDR